MNNIIKTSFCITFCLAEVPRYVAWGALSPVEVFADGAPASSEADESTQINTF